MIASAPHASAPGPERPRLIPLVVAATFFMQMLDGSIVNTSLPQMARSLGVQPLDLSLGVTIYMLCSAAFLPLSGWLADRFGARRVYLAAIAVFAVASSGCGLAQENWHFVLARALQGLGGAMMTPVGRIVVLRSTGKADLLNAMATITWPALTAPLLGPVVGGLVTSSLSWRVNFLANLPVGLAAFLLVRRFVPDYQGEKEKSFDLKGLTLVSSSLMILLYGLESLAHSHGVFWIPGACILTGSVLGAAALRHLRASPQPLLDLGVFRHPTFSISVLTAGLWVRVAITSAPFLLPLLFQEALGYGPMEAGWFLLAYFTGNFAMKSVAVRALRRFGFRTVVVANGLIVGAAALAFTGFSRSMPAAWMAGVLVIAGLSRSMQFTSLSSLVFADIDERERSSASTVSSMFLQISMALGVSAGASLLAVSRALRGGGTGPLALADFRFAFAGAACFAFISSWLFLRLPKDAGAEITGHARAESAPAGNPSDTAAAVEPEAALGLRNRIPHELQANI
jgi:EmrB/QacA subfamily drug resistance transporter